MFYIHQMVPLKYTLRTLSFLFETNLKGGVFSVYVCIPPSIKSIFLQAQKLHYSLLPIKYFRYSINDHLKRCPFIIAFAIETEWK